MPELAEDMYCSQQICIPPNFPYLLRQYAKAAIRTQPGDLLRWSTAYFRCLALNLPPPVKPRLEYPITKTHFGLTPGWLRALLHQLQNNLTVPFKVLWDRWIGACLQHQNLIEILCLGGFTDPYAIPWFRFVALCASHLTDNLTQTMILVCEILTEEPEGGSAMIPVEVFTDVYQFLANIDASQPQWIRNIYFTDSLLSLYREPSVVEVKETVAEIPPEEEEEIVEAEEEKVEVVEAKVEEDLIGVVISCPDIAADDYKTEEDFLNQEKEREEKEAADKEKALDKKTKDEKMQTAAAKKATPDKKTDKIESVPEPEDEDKTDDVTVDETETASEMTEVSQKPDEEVGADESEAKEVLPAESEDTILDYMPEREGDKESEQESAEPEEEKEQMGEEEEQEKMDDEIVKLKRVLEGTPGPVLSEVFGSEESEKREEMEGEEEEEVVEEKGELIYVDAVPGIGPIVPQHLLAAVVKYMHECAKNQHGMIMPRNVRHFNCPPLEILS